MNKAYDYDPAKHKFVVTVDHSYYPDVTYCETIHEADAVVKKIIEDDAREGAGNSYGRRPAVIVAEIRLAHQLSERDDSGRKPATVQLQITNADGSIVIVDGVRQPNGDVRFDLSAVQNLSRLVRVLPIINGMVFATIEREVPILPGQSISFNPSAITISDS